MGVYGINKIPQKPLLDQVKFKRQLQILLAV